MDTKCDLSHNLARLDFEAMLATARVAVGNCIENIPRYNAAIRDAALHQDATAIHLNASWLAREAKHLTISADVLATLMGAQTREVIEITNHNPTPEAGS